MYPLASWQSLRDRKRPVRPAGPPPQPAIYEILHRISIICNNKLKLQDSAVLNPKFACRAGATQMRLCPNIAGGSTLQWSRSNCAEPRSHRVARVGGSSYLFYVTMNRPSDACRGRHPVPLLPLPFAPTMPSALRWTLRISGSLTLILLILVGTLYVMGTRAAERTHTVEPRTAPLPTDAVTLTHDKQIAHGAGLLRLLRSRSARPAQPRARCSLCSRPLARRTVAV